MEDCIIKIAVESAGDGLIDAMAVLFMSCRYVNNAIVRDKKLPWPIREYAQKHY